MTPDFPQFVPCLAPLGHGSLPWALHKPRHATLARIEEPLARFLPTGCLEKKASKDHSRERLYPLHRVFWCWLWQILQANTAWRQVVRQLQVLFSLQGQSIDEGTCAYCQSRLKIPLAWLRPLVPSTAARARRLVPASTLLQGRCLKALEGSSVRLADTRQNQQCYPQPHFQKPGAGFPLMRILTLLCLASGAVLGCVSGRRFESEISLAAELFDSLIEGDVVVADRGFGNFIMAALLQQRGVDFIARVPTRIRKIDFRKGRGLAGKDSLFVWQKSKRPSRWMPLTRWLALPQTLTIRVLQVRVCIPGMRVQVITLMTTLLDPKLYRAKEIAEAFGRRWRHEMCFDDLKTTLNMAHLKSLIPAMAQKE